MNNENKFVSVSLEDKLHNVLAEFKQLLVTTTVPLDAAQEIADLRKELDYYRQTALRLTSKLSDTEAALLRLTNEYDRVRAASEFLRGDQRVVITHNGQGKLTAFFESEPDPYPNE